MDKEDLIYINIYLYRNAIYIYLMEYYSAKKEWYNAICSNMDGPRDERTK